MASILIKIGEGLSSLTFKNNGGSLMKIYANSTKTLPITIFNDYDYKPGTEELYYGISSGYKTPVLYKHNLDENWYDASAILSGGTTIPASSGITEIEFRATYDPERPYFIRYKSNGANHWKDDPSRTIANKNDSFKYEAESCSYTVLESDAYIPYKAPEYGVDTDINRPWRLLYTFEYWTYGELGVNHVYPGDVVNILPGTSASPSLDLLAHWSYTVKQSQFIISLTNNGSTYDFSGYQDNRSYTVSNLPTPTRSGYIFQGWTDGTNIVSSVKIDDSNWNRGVSLTAVWIKATGYNYHFIFSSKNDELQTGYYQYAKLGPYLDLQSTYTLDFADAPIPTDYITYTGYTFKGWATTFIRADQGIVDYTVNDEETYNGTSGLLTTVILYAVWEEEPYDTKFYWDLNDGSQDANIINTRLPISNLTNVRWNAFQRKIKKYNGAFTPAIKNEYDLITYTDFNNARQGILDIPGMTISLVPSAVNRGDVIMASSFRGNISLLAALNSVIHEGFSYEYYLDAACTLPATAGTHYINKYAYTTDATPLVCPAFLKTGYLKVLSALYIDLFLLGAGGSGGLAFATRTDGDAPGVGGTAGGYSNPSTFTVNGTTYSANGGQGGYGAGFTSFGSYGARVGQDGRSGGSGSGGSYAVISKAEGSWWSSLSIGTAGTNGSNGGTVGTGDGGTGQGTNVVKAFGLSTGKLFGGAGGSVCASVTSGDGVEKNAGTGGAGGGTNGVIAYYGDSTKDLRGISAEDNTGGGAGAFAYISSYSLWCGLSTGGAGGMARTVSNILIPANSVIPVVVGEGIPFSLAGFTMGKGGSGIVLIKLHE